MRNVYVLGSINMDIVAHAQRHPMVGETVAGTSLAYFPGGKGANQAVAAARMGATTRMVGMLGNDAFAASLQEFLTEMGVDLTHVSSTATTPSGTALIVVGDGDNTIVVVPGANGELAPSDADAVAAEAGDVLVAQFETPADTTKSFFDAGKQAGARTILNPAPAAQIDVDLLALCDIVVLNETELAFLTGDDSAFGLDDTMSIGATVAGVRTSEEQVWILTLGAAGVVAVPGSRAETIVVQGHEVDVADPTGAGDCFVGSLAASLAAGEELAQGLARANAAAALCVTSHGAGPSMPARPVVDSFLNGA